MKARVDIVEGARIAAFSLTANRLRTVLTTVGVGIGVMTLLAILSVIQGLNNAFSKDLASIGTSTLYIQKFPWNGSQWWKYRNRKNIELNHILALRNEPHVLAAAPTIADRKQATFLDRSRSGVVIIGSTEDYALTTGFDVDMGRNITPADDDNHLDVVVLGDDVRQGLFGRESPLGQRISLGTHKFTVIGTFKRKGGSAMMGNPDLRVLIPLHTFENLFGSHHWASGMVLVDDPKNIDSAMDHITGTLRRLRQTPPADEDDFAINRADVMLEMYNKLTGALFGVVAAVGFITLLVGGIGIMNIMLVSVRERTREIGLRRALGARQRTIVIQFLMEAAAVSAVGGGLGALCGLGIAKTIAFSGMLDAALTPFHIIGGIGFAAIMGLLFGIWPAARAATLDPVEALRYE
jgi:putative ABC transport system permease protein